MADSPPDNPIDRELIETLLDQLPHFFFVHDADLRFRYANAAAAAYFGRTKAGIVGRRHRDVDDPEQAAFYEATLRPLIAAGEPVTTDPLPYRKPDGTDGHLQAFLRPFRHPVTDEQMVVGLSLDVTERERFGHERELRGRYEAELDLARQIQQHLLSTAVPHVPGRDLAAACEPATHIGGDFYDFIHAPGGRTVVLLGDVTGHGVAPALLAATVRSTARVLFRTLGFTEAMVELDRQLCADFPPGRFVTLAAVELAPAPPGHPVPPPRLLSAGHGPVLHVRPDGRGDVLPTHGLPMGLGANPVFDDPTLCPLGPNDLLVLPSDGLIEPRNAAGEPFGPDRLAAAVASASDLPAAVAAAYAAETAWRTGEPEDDRTLVCLRTTP